MTRIWTLLISGLFLVTVIGLWQFSGRGSPTRYPETDPALVEQYNQEKQLLEEARSRKDLGALEGFLRDHPESAWRETAMFYRDQLAYHQALAKGDARSLREYLARYPDSQWRGFAEQRLDQMEREQAARISRMKRQQQLGKRGSTGSSSNGTNPISSPAESAAATERLLPPSPAKRPLDARERVQRALSIYEQQNANRKFEQTRKQQKQQAERKHQQDCQRLQDQIRQFDDRIRWYRLDEQGQRVFLTADEVAARKRETEASYRRNCQ